jgi:hypothetical protein
MNGRFQMQGGKNWILLKEMNANRLFWDSHWLEIWSNHFCPSMGPNGGSVHGSVAMDSGHRVGIYDVRTAGAPRVVQRDVLVLQLAPGFSRDSQQLLL